MDMHRGRRKFLVIAALGMALVAASSCFTQLDTTPVLSPEGTTTTLIIVRHAERDPGDATTIPLNAEGLIRANALAAALGENGVDAIFAPDITRNLQTAAPLAEDLNIEVTVIPLLDVADTRAFANTFVERITTEYAGKVVLFIGNTGPAVGDQSGNLQELYARLGGLDNPPIKYEDLYVAVIPEEGEVSWVKGTYGGPSSLD
jgi:hypothetical protein